MSRWNEKGFSFVELMVALALVAASFGVLISAHTYALRKEAHARQLFTASALMRQLLTEAELGGAPPDGDSEGDFGDDFPDFRWTRRVADADLSAMAQSALKSLGITNVQIPAGLGGVKSIELTVRWAESEKPEHVSMTYYVVPQ